MNQYKSELHRALYTMTRLGIDVEYGRLSLCNLGKYCITRNILEHKYQVDCDDANIRFSHVYNNHHSAIDKWVALYAALKSKEMKLEETEGKQ